MCVCVFVCCVRVCLCVYVCVLLTTERNECKCVGVAVRVREWGCVRLYCVCGARGYGVCGALRVCACVCVVGGGGGGAEACGVWHYGGYGVCGSAVVSTGAGACRR